MAIDYWHDMSILVGGIELAGYGKDVRLMTEVAAKDTTALSTTGWTTAVGGLKSGSVEMTLMQDMAAGSVDATLYDLLGDTDVPHSVVSNSADGSKCYLFRGIPLSYTPIEGPVGEIAGARISGRSSTGGVVRGTLIHPGSASRTSSSTGTGRQVGAVASGKSLYAALHVLSVSGTNPTLDVKVQSDDNASFTSATDRITFTQATAVGSQWSSVAGAITDDYWRVSYTIGGTGTPTFAFAVTVGIL